MSIQARNITKQFGSFYALNDVSIDFPAGELVALLGPSGSGKTTLLRVIAGLESADSGSVLFDGEDATQRSARDRRVGFVFQHYALFRHMTVFDNVAFGLRVKPRDVRPSKDEIKDRVTKLLKLVQLDWIADRYPSQLSGGQRQRIALARALAVEPKVLLLDEPFGALDSKVRKELRRWLRRLHDEIHVTSIFVTHDVDEALEVSDKVVVMNKGKIEQVGTPAEVYDNPANAFVHDFLGDVNVLHSELEQESQKRTASFVRPHDIEIFRQAAGSDDLKAVVEHLQAVGPIVRVELKTDAGRTIEAELRADTYRELKLQLGEQVFVHAKNVRTYEHSYDI